jgi:hypothetical protein
MWGKRLASTLAAFWAALSTIAKWLAPGAKARSATILANGTISEWTMDVGENASQSPLAESVVMISVKSRPKAKSPSSPSKRMGRHVDSIDELVQPKLTGVWVALSLIVVLLGTAAVLPL